MEEEIKQLTEQLRFWKHKRNELVEQMKEAEESIAVTEEQIEELRLAAARRGGPDV